LEEVGHGVHHKRTAFKCSRLCGCCRFQSLGSCARGWFDRTPRADKRMVTREGLDLEERQ
jgi:hypothetical protein